MLFSKKKIWSKEKIFWKKKKRKKKRTTTRRRLWERKLNQEWKRRKRIVLISWIELFEREEWEEEEWSPWQWKRIKSMTYYHDIPLLLLLLLLLLHIEDNLNLLYHDNNS
jgi:hypothetical protein